MAKVDLGQLLGAFGRAVDLADHAHKTARHAHHAATHAAEVGKPGKTRMQRADHVAEATLGVASAFLFGRRLYQALRPQKSPERPTETDK